MNTVKLKIDYPSGKLIAILSLMLSFLIAGCNENPSQFTLGEEFIDSQTNLTVVDTFAVSFSTMILDTVKTSSTGTILVGNYTNENFGRISSQGYFQIGACADEILDAEIYDSVEVVVTYSGYYIGDTTRTQEFLAHRLTERISSSDDYFTNRSAFAYEPTPLGSAVFTPALKSSDTLAIRINDELGLDLFEKMDGRSEIVTESENFINYFNGLVLIPGENSDGLILGFDADSSSAKIVVHSHTTSLTTTEYKHEFPLENSNHQFNHISHDFTATGLSSLAQQRVKLSSTEAAGLSYIMGGVGLVTRIDFPSLPEILLFERGIFPKVELEIATTNKYNSDPPTDLILYATDKLNNLLSEYGSLASTTETTNELFEEETIYTFDLTSYLETEMADSYVDPQAGLLLMIPSSDLRSTFDHLIIDEQNVNTKLKIYYLSY